MGSLCSSSATAKEVTIGGDEDDSLGEATRQFDDNARRLILYSRCLAPTFGDCDKVWRKSGYAGEH